MRACRIGGAGERIAHGLVAEHLGQFGQDLQVLLSSVVRNKNDKNQGYGLCVGRIEGYRLLQSNERSEGLAKMFKTSMGNGNTVAEPRGSQFLPGEQAVVDRASGKVVAVFE